MTTISPTPLEARTQIVSMVRDFVRNEVEPVAAQHDAEDTVPYDLIDQMKELGLFGITVPEEYGGMGLDYTTFAMIFEEISKGYMALTGTLGTHHILAYVLTHYGTQDNATTFCPVSPPRNSRRPGLNRAQRRQRRGSPGNSRRQGWRGIRGERLQDVYHQRRFGGCFLPASPHQPRPLHQTPWPVRIRHRERRA